MCVYMCVCLKNTEWKEQEAEQYFQNYHLCRFSVMPYYMYACIKL